MRREPAFQVPESVEPVLSQPFKGLCIPCLNGPVRLGVRVRRTIDRPFPYRAVGYRDSSPMGGVTGSIATMGPERTGTPPPWFMWPAYSWGHATELSWMTTGCQPLV
jgi:hypothetical protein